MPTGYTESITNDMTFVQFAQRCARAMSALVRMRDDPMDAPIPEKFEPSKWYAEEAEKLHARLTYLGGLSDSDIAAEYKREREESLKRLNDGLVCTQESRRKYERMRRLVSVWVPPTDGHVGFKNFMLRQIEESIECDCDETYYRGTSAEVSPKDWLVGTMAALCAQIIRMRKEQEMEDAITAERNVWILELRRSLEIYQPPESGSA